MRPGWYYFWRFAWSASPGTFGKALYLGTGLSATQISVFSSVANVVDMVSAVVLHRFADAHSYYDRNNRNIWKEFVLCGCFVSTTILFYFYFWLSDFAVQPSSQIIIPVIGHLDKTQTVFLMFLLLTAVDSAIRAGVYPIEKEIVLDHLPNSDSFGAERVFGTYAWAITHLLYGYLIDTYDLSILWMLKPFTCLASVGTVFLLSRRPLPPHLPTTPRTPIHSRKKLDPDSVSSPMMLFGFTLAQCGFILLMSLYAIGKNIMLNQAFIYFREVLGSSNTTIGITICVGCILEAPALTYSSLLRKNLGYRALMGLGCVAFCIRIVGITFVSPGILLVLLEMLQGISFAFTDTAITYFVEGELSKHPLGSSMESSLNAFTKFVGMLGSIVAAHYTDKRGHSFVFRWFSGIMFIGIVTYGLIVVTNLVKKPVTEAKKEL
jgi:Na+/melibiose symporter-like transporter